MSPILRKKENDPYAINPVTDFFLVFALIINVLRTLSLAITLKENILINSIELVIGLCFIVVLIKIMDNNKYALYALPVICLVRIIFQFIIIKNMAVVYIFIGVIVFWAILFCLPKNRKASWKIIRDTPIEQTNHNSSTKLIYGLFIAVALFALAGFFFNKGQQDDTYGRYGRYSDTHHSVVE